MQHQTEQRDATKTPFVQTPKRFRGTVSKLQRGRGTVSRIRIFPDPKHPTYFEGSGSDYGTRIRLLVPINTNVRDFNRYEVLGNPGINAEEPMIQI